MSRRWVAEARRRRIDLKKEEMQLNLKRPMVFFDIEATGLSVTNDRIVELCLIKVFPDGSDEEKVIRFNPEMHISDEASAVNGIYDEDVADCATFKEKSQELFAYLSGCDLAGFNSNRFDIPMLVEEFSRAGIDYDLTEIKLVDVQTIFHKMERRNLVAALKFYCGKDLENAHTALADTQATYDVLKAQLDHYKGEVENDVDWLADFSRQNNNVDLAGRIVYNEEGVETFNFGKYRGQTVASVLRRDPGYFNWVMQGDFTQNTKQVLRRIQFSAK